MSFTGPCITLVLGGTENGDTATELKDGLNRFRKEMESRGPEGESVLASVNNALRDIRGETRSKGAIVVLGSPSVTRVFRANGPVKPLSRAADRFDIRTLLALQGGQKEFYILALSQNRTRLLRCSEDSSEEIPIPGAPASLADAMQTRPPDHVLDNRASGGPSIGAGAVMFGTSSDRDDKDEYMLHFFMEIDKAVAEALKDSTDPLIAVGVEHEIALYRRVNTYPHLLEPGVSGAPDGLEGGEMHHRALELLERRAAEFGFAIPADFDKRVGTGHASAHIQDIVTAAWEGRVSHLFLQANASYSGTFDPVRMRVKHTEDPLDSPIDLTDSAAEQTILHGGEVRIVPGSAMPNGVPVCALMRYPAVQHTVSGTGPVDAAA
jgi:hypothetical protein